MDTSKSMNNLEIAELLRDVAASYQLQDDKKNKFKIIAYQRAADAVEHMSSEAKDLWDDGKLEGVGGIGPSIAQHLGEIFKTGRSKHFDELMKGIPPAVFELMTIPGIGVKRAFRLVTELKVNSIAELKKAAESNKISGLEGFGEDSQSAILKSVGEVKKDKKRMLLPYATQTAQEIIDWVKKDPSVKHADPLGSLRRKVSTVGDVDIAAASDKPQQVLEHFTKYPHASRVLEKGTRSAAIILPSGVQVDILVGETATYGSILQHFTGSKHHNVALREYALKKGLSLSDYGIYTKPGDPKSLKEIATEEQFYKFLGMDWIPPELREDTGEIQAALDHKLPKLVEAKDIKADLQIHSSFDIETSHDLGASTMEEVISAANKLGYEYLAFTEHNPSKSKHSQKEIVDILKRKREKVDKINYSIVKDVKSSVKKVFNSLEIDILPNGELPVPEEGLATLDFALVSIHSSFRLPRQEMTARVLRALEYPNVKIFAHPTGRKLNEREGIEVDWEKIFEACLTKNIWIEINSDPARLDLPDNLVHEAVKKGIKLTLGTDSHHKDGLVNMQYGVSVARRGWATKSDIINTLSLNDFEKSLRG
ncbi:MAG TPA: helix-hairpin-helix domain-containing protein [Patescibacteria group bacterium]